jgi:hypothetical protein
LRLLRIEDPSGLRGFRADVLRLLQIKDFRFRGLKFLGKKLFFEVSNYQGSRSQLQGYRAEVLRL